ncbi:phosphonate ABC transporter, permease protein PhnE [Pseudorhodoplanes sp.]|uniref:phosphonate ABC transporter, permease protein PhnE n=1 Tax=Pseudorhodoplanes sp. TaxID=1934341 RepID=UPI0039195A71
MIDRVMSAARAADLKRRYPFAFRRPLREQVLRLAGWTAFSVLTLYCLWRFDFSPVKLWSGLGELGGIVTQLFPPMPGEHPREIFWALLETIAMAFIGTTLAAILAFPLAFLAAKNTFPFGLARFGVRRFMDMLRGIDQLIWALIFVRAVGLGPLAGIMAIAISDTGTLAKLFSESLENIEKKPAEGLKAAGANNVQTLRFAMLPQVIPMFLSSALYMFESNVRSATILGIVGAGGIGFQLSDRIRAHHWEEACFILILILITVAIIDWISKNLRMWLIGR